LRDKMARITISLCEPFHSSYPTKSSLVRESLAARFSVESAAAPSCYDVARDLAGSVHGLPEDLAVNPDYMEGFGR
jgi:hypothetical protein